jgi:hypothetical protein
MMEIAAFFPPVDGMKNSINLYAYAAGTGDSIAGSKVRANSNPKEFQLIKI